MDLGLSGQVAIVTGASKGIGLAITEALARDTQAFIASLTDDALLAATAATGVYTVAAEQAAAYARGPGSFAANFLDRLAGITPDDVVAALDVRPADLAAHAS